WLSHSLVRAPSPYLHSLVFFFNVAATTEIYTLSLHDALPISYTFESEPDWTGAADLQGRQDDAVRRLRAQRDFRAHHRRLLRDGRQPEPGDQAVGHRLLEQEPSLFPRRLARLQRGSRPHAVGWHR